MLYVLVVAEDSVNINLRLDRTVLERVDAERRADRRTRTAEINVLLDEALTNREQKR